ncbi:MAG: hypothetical protein QM687_07955 [Ferruginibacter sp.]
MENEETELRNDEEQSEDVQISNFSMIISIVFVTIVVAFLYVKILFD